MIGVLIVDDEALTLDLHRTFVERCDGFRVAGESTGARAAVSAVLDTPPTGGIDLVLLDMTMPDGTGLDVLRHIRARSAAVDVIAITSVRDADVVRQAIALGAVQYLVKPFTFATFHERMAQYRAYRERAQGAVGPATQAEIDALMGGVRPTGSISLPHTVPKGLSRESLARVTTVVRERGPLSSAETAEQLGMSRVTARRYLEYLVDEGTVVRSARYRGRGRPETEYGWQT